MENVNTIDAYVDNEISFTFPGRYAVCAPITSNAETSTTPTTLIKLLADKARARFWTEVAGTVEIPVYSYSSYCHAY